MSSPGAGCPREGTLGQPSPPGCSSENRALVGGGYGEGKPLAAVQCVGRTRGRGCWGAGGVARGGDEGICGPVCLRHPAVGCAAPWVAHRGVTFRWGTAVGTAPGWDTSSHPLWGQGAALPLGTWGWGCCRCPGSPHPRPGCEASLQQPGEAAGSNQAWRCHRWLCSSGCAAPVPRQPHRVAPSSCHRAGWCDAG